MRGVFREAASVRRSGRHAAIAALGAVLAGCSSSGGISTSKLSSMFSTSTAQTATDASAAAVPGQPDFECPSLVIRQGAGTLAVAADPRDPTALNLRYQVSFGQLARECRVVAKTVHMKVGVQGRVVLGPAGGPGQVDVPVRLAVMR
jgi:hypothetical protein